MNVYEYKDYRDFLSKLIKESPQRGFQASLAKAAGCQASHLSQVLKQKVHLTEDQAIGIADYIELSAMETEYFILLIRLAKAATIRLQRFLEKLIEESQGEQLALSQRVDAKSIVSSSAEVGMYTSSWIPSAVHLLTSSPSHQTVEKIASRLNLSTIKVKETLLLLVKMGFVENQNDQWKYSNGAIHLPKNSPWNSSFQNSRRHLAIKSISENKQDSFHFSSVFTIDESDRDELKKLLGSYIEKSHKIISNSGTADLCCMCLDFFSI